MENESQHHYELRSRSRSRSQTPMVLNQTLQESELTDHHYDLRSRSRERSHTPGEVTSSRRSGTRSLPSSGGKKREKSMDMIIERKEDSNSETTDQHSESSASNVSRKAERRSERQRVKRQIFSNGQTETKENASESKTTEKRQSVTPRRTITSDYSSEEGEKEDPPSRPGSAYEIYKQAGDWWNVFPKTDYTYSEHSLSRYEIAPGVLAMPNMSRPSIHSDGNSTTGSVHSFSQQNLSLSRTRDSFGESMDQGDARETIEQNRLNEMNACGLRSYHAQTKKSGDSIIYKKTHVAQYKSHREIIYGNTDSLSRRNRYDLSSQIDSDAEIDEAVSSRYRSRENTWKLREWSEIVWRTVAIWSYAAWNFLNIRVLRRKTSTSHEYHRYQESKWQKAWTQIDRTMQYLYFLLVRILLLDTWLLSRTSNAREHLRRRRSRVLWLIFLPPLLLAGFGILSQTRNLGGFFSSVGNWNREYNDRGNVFVPLREEVASSAAEFDEARLKSLLDPLVRRLEKLETANTVKNEQVENLNTVMEELREKNSTVWERYNEKLQTIEDRFDQKSRESVDELNALKLEFSTLRGLYGSLKTCCDKNAVLTSNEDMEKQVELIMAGYFGPGVSKEELNRIVQTLIMASETENSKKIANPPEQSGDSGENLCTEKSTLSDEDVQKIVNKILKIYDADKTGRVDYALESAGGQVISTRCTQRYNVHTRAFKLLGFTLFYENNNPRTVIQGNHLQPGACWAFQDFPGYLLVKLRSFIRVTGFTLEHAPRSLLPNNEMKSAPRKFNVWGLKNESDVDPVMFGEYEFADSDESLQYFPVQNEEIVDPYEYVELRIHSNHGQLEYTCLYRFRVHGIPV